MIHIYSFIQNKLNTMANRFCCGSGMMVCFFCVVVHFVISFVLGLFFSWINVHTVKSGATCYVQNFYVPALNKTAGNYTTGNHTSINLVLHFVNPYEYMGIYYDNLNLTFYYGRNRSLPIGSYTASGFHQSAEDNTDWRDHVVETTRGIPWETVPKNGSMVAFRVDLSTAVRYNQMFWKGKRRMLRVGAGVEVNDTTGLKVKKKAIKLKSGAPELHRVGLLMVLLSILFRFLFDI